MPAAGMQKIVLGGRRAAGFFAGQRGIFAGDLVDAGALGGQISVAGAGGLPGQDKCARTLVIRRAHDVNRKMKKV